MLRRAGTLLLLKQVPLDAQIAAAEARDALPVLTTALLAHVRGAASTAGPSGVASSGPASAAPRHNAGRSAATATASAAAEASTSGSAETPLSFFTRQAQALSTMPTFPKLLGFAGAIPFLSLTPQMVTAAGLPDMIDYCAQMQLVYGGSIVTFLGAVHWGLAMNNATLAAAGSKAAGALNERYVWSVVPSLAAVPALMMQPAQGSFAISVLLFICYLSDSSYFKSGYLPSWYMSLRGYLTLLAIVSMLSTTIYYFGKDLEKARKRMEEDDAKRAARLEARVAAGGTAAGAGAAGAVAAAAGLAGKR